MAQRKKSYLFSWEQYRDKAWWNKIRIETTRDGVSINQLLCELLDLWFTNESYANESMLYALKEIKRLWDKHGLGDNEDESGPVYRLMIEAIKRGNGK